MLEGFKTMFKQSCWKINGNILFEEFIDCQHLVIHTVILENKYVIKY